LPVLSTMEGTLRFTDPLSTEWVTTMLMLVFMLLAYTNVAAPKKWRLLWGAIFTLRLGKQAMREDVDLQDRTLIGLVGASLIVLALFAYQAVVLLGAPATGLVVFGRTLGLVVLVLVAQIVVLWLVDFLFEADGGTREYLYTVLLLTVALGLLLLPVVTLMAYQPDWRRVLLPVGGALAATYVLYRWLRGAVIGVGDGVPPRHVFLYLCTAEILPVALALRSALH
jgi:hypothetical protein